MNDTSGLSSRPPFAHYDPATSCWRMWPAISLSASARYSGTWPRSGTMRAGFASRLPGWEPRTAARGSSSTQLLPTPEANQGSNGGSQHPDKRQGFGNHSVQLQDVVEHTLPTPKAKDRAARGPGADGGPDLGEAVALLNSPTGSDGTGVGVGRRRDSTLRGQIDTLIPTPTKEHHARSSSVEDRDPGSQAHIGKTLQDWADEMHPLLPTPAAARAGDSPEAHLAKKPGRTTVTNLEVMATGGLLPTPRATDGTNGGPNQRGSAGDLTLPSAALQLMPTPGTEQRGNDLPNREGGASLTGTVALMPTPAAADANGEIEMHLPTPSTAGGGERTRGGDRSDELLLEGVAQEFQLDWGPYEPAIRRWERTLGREAPWATEPAPRSKKGRLAPRFVEWMMGWAEGWVTRVPGLSRNQQLKILGNGVVPQQAEAAVRFLLAPPAHREAPKTRARPAKRPKTAKAWLKAAR